MSENVRLAIYFGYGISKVYGKHNIFRKDILVNIVRHRVYDKLLVPNDAKRYGIPDEVSNILEADVRTHQCV